MKLSEKTFRQPTAPSEFTPYETTSNGNYATTSVDKLETFKKGEGTVDFRGVSWPRATVIFLKIIFAVGVLSIPVSMASLGAVAGSLVVLGFGALNTYTGVIQGDFRNNHPQCHSIADMAMLVSGPVGREITGVLFIISYIIVGGSGILGVSIALNALSDHAACSVWWSFLATLIVALSASIRTFERIGLLTWAGFASIFTAVFIVVIGVTTRSRPAAAPATGAFDLGYYAVAHPTFVSGMVASSTIFVSSAANSAFLPVISEMARPQDYRKALFTCMGFVTAAYLSFSLVVYRWCGQWVASPSLGSAGPTVKKVSYGIGLVGLVVSACLYIHVGAKYVFVRVLRGTRHLQEGTVVHWVTWLSCTIGLAAIAFILAEAIPIFNYLLSLVGALSFAPLAISLPGYLWLYDHRSHARGSPLQKAAYIFHVALIPLGLFFCVAGTYATVVQIQEAYRTGAIGSAFSCADNSNSS